MMVYNALKKLFTIGLAISLIAFALSFVLSLLENRLLKDLAALFATLVLALTPLASVVFIAMEEAKRRNYGGLMTAALVMLVILISLVLMLGGSAS
ncbi:MAG: hypothetical protein QXD66_02155 [Candidatus Nezhaarchaeales archaeon]|nr:MAG: hypothetical protein DSO05_04210 [Candidatus Nezhaarchaeota archaeon WYZ-LMO7]TDA36351.1 MAG: hypothetical protein DSO06_00545 [Candidatus Nezhaarchaeota archaeon WYZ-LMO8]